MFGNDQLTKFVDDLVASMARRVTPAEVAATEDAGVERSVQVLLSGVSARVARFLSNSGGIPFGRWRLRRCLRRRLLKEGYHVAFIDRVARTTCR